MSNISLTVNVALIGHNDERDEEITRLPLVQKQFKTGSRGYHASSKITINGKRYQANFMLVEIGSKPHQDPSEPDFQILG